MDLKDAVARHLNDQVAFDIKLAEMIQNRAFDTRARISEAANSYESMTGAMFSAMESRIRDLEELVLWLVHDMEHSDAASAAKERLVSRTRR